MTSLASYIANDRPGIWTTDGFEEGFKETFGFAMNPNRDIFRVTNSTKWTSLQPINSLDKFVLFRIEWFFEVRYEYH